MSKQTDGPSVLLSLPDAFQPWEDKATGLIFHSKKSLTRSGTMYLFLENDLGFFYLGTSKIDPVIVCKTILAFLIDLKGRTD